MGRLNKIIYLPRTKSLRKREPSTLTPCESHSSRSRLPANVRMLWSSMMAEAQSGWTST